LAAAASATPPLLPRSGRRGLALKAASFSGELDGPSINFTVEETMKSNVMTHLSKALSLTMACALALGLAACEQEQNFGKVGKGIDSAFGTSGQQQAAEQLPTDPRQEKLVLAENADDDAALAARVKAAISSNAGLRSVTVDVNAVKGVVTLYGTADTPVMSREAAMIALNVDGVRSVKNEMVIVKGS
jgi:osmotically-inducible protein OsmY